MYTADNEYNENGSIYENKDMYKLFSKNYMVVFNHNYVYGEPGDRSGTEKDAMSLKSTFRSLRFEVDTNDDFDKNDIYTALSSLAKKDFTEYGCVAVVVLTHGSEGGLLSAKDQSYNEQIIIDHLKVTKNPTLLNKPRIVIINACRGDDSLEGIKTGQPSTLGNRISGGIYSMPEEPDMLIFHSSFIGKASNRIREEGTWFIQTLCNKINMMPHDINMSTLLTEVRKDVAINKELLNEKTCEKQMPTTTSTLTKKLYLQKVLNYPDGSSDIGCPCIDVYFKYLMDCLENFVELNPENIEAKKILEEGFATLRDQEHTRDDMKDAATNICNFFKNNVKNEIFFNFMYLYTEKE